MKNGKLFLALVLVLTLAFVALPSMAQEAAVTDEKTEAVAEAPAVEEPVVAEAPVAVEETAPVAEQVEDVSGEVVSFDAENSILVLKYVVDQEMNIEKEESFDLSATTEITKGDMAIAFSDIAVGDMATVKCVIDADGNKTVKSVMIEAAVEAPAAE